MKTRKVNKVFIEKELIPFVLREQGRGFEMTFWRRQYTGGQYYSYDLGMAPVEVPVCNTVACLGGSVACILIAKGRDCGDLQIAAEMGLTPEQADGLFYYWRPNSTTHYRWPKAFALKFKAANTKLAKAQVAVALLRHIVKTDGACLKARVFEKENFA